MTLVGHQDRFAVEFELEAAKLADSVLAPWLFGRVRWWIAGAEVGAYENTSLRDVVNEAARFLEHQGRRDGRDLARLPSSEVVDVLDSALFVDSGQSTEQLTLDEQRYRRFVVKPLVDVFARWDIFLVGSDEHERLIWRSDAETAVREVALENGEFDSVLKEFVHAVAAQSVVKNAKSDL